MEQGNLSQQVHSFSNIIPNLKLLESGLSNDNKFIKNKDYISEGDYEKGEVKLTGKNITFDIIEKELSIYYPNLNDIKNSVTISNILNYIKPQ